MDYRVAFICWVDSCTYECGWQDGAELLEWSEGMSPEIRSIGIILREDDDCITIVQSIDTREDDEDGEVVESAQHALKIPKCSIRNMACSTFSDIKMTWPPTALE